MQFYQIGSGFGIAAAWQWQPVTYDAPAHDPSPPITIEDADWVINDAFGDYERVELTDAETEGSQHQWSDQFIESAAAPVDDGAGNDDFNDHHDGIEWSDEIADAASLHLWADQVVEAAPLDEGAGNDDIGDRYDAQNWLDELTESALHVWSDGGGIEDAAPGDSFGWDDHADFDEPEQSALHQWSSDYADDVADAIFDSFAFDADDQAQAALVDALHDWSSGPFDDAPATDDGADAFAFDDHARDDELDAAASGASIHAWASDTIEDLAAPADDGAYGYFFDERQDDLDDVTLFSWADQFIEQPAALDDGADSFAFDAHERADELEASGDAAQVHQWADQAIDALLETIDSFDGSQAVQDGDSAIDSDGLHSWGDSPIEDAAAPLLDDTQPFDFDGDQASSAEFQQAHSNPDLAAIHAWADQAIEDLFPLGPGTDGRPDTLPVLFVPERTIRTLRQHVTQEERAKVSEAKRRRMIQELYEKLQGYERTSEQAQAIVKGAGAITARPLIGGESMEILNAGRLLLDLQAVAALLALYMAAQAQLASEDEDLAILLLMG